MFRSKGVPNKVDIKYIHSDLIQISNAGLEKMAQENLTEFLTVFWLGLENIHIYPVRGSSKFLETCCK